MPDGLTGQFGVVSSPRFISRAYQLEVKVKREVSLESKVPVLLANLHLAVQDPRG